jgi:hypothetical protein
MKRHIAYGKYVLRHKWYVLVACRALGVSLWRAITHDWTKLLPSEWLAYATTFYEPDGSKKRYEETPAFARAWCLHQKRNDHHWQQWVTVRDSGGFESLPMSEAAVREMVADWVAAGMAITGCNDVRGWYEKNRTRMSLHPQTRELVESLMDRASAVGME